MTETSPPSLPFTLDDYAAYMSRDERTEDERCRAILCDLPRQMRWVDHATRQAILDRAPALTHTKWDALLAAMAEHLARLHGHEHLAWMDEPERFHTPGWIPNARVRLTMERAMIYSPGSFIRHGTPIDPSDLDARGGESHDWIFDTESP